MYTPLFTLQLYFNNIFAFHLYCCTLTPWGVVMFIDFLTINNKYIILLFYCLGKCIQIFFFDFFTIYYLYE